MPRSKAANSKITLLKILLKRPDFLLSMLAGIVLLITFYYWLLLKVSNIETTLSNISSEPLYRTAVFILVPVVLILFGLNFALSVLLFRAKGGLKWQGGSLLGAFTGGFAAACPVCGAFLLSLIGVAGGLTVLPFAGLEIWTVAGGVMGVAFFGSLIALDKKTCDIKSGKDSCWRLPEVKTNQVVLLLVITLLLFANLYLTFSRNESFLKSLAPSDALNLEIKV